MTKKHDELNLDRRGFLRSMAWVGTGAMWTLTSGVLKGVTATPRAQASAAQREVIVDDFNFSPASTAVPAGTTVTWINRDGMPHNIVSVDRKFKSPVLDTDQRFSHTFETPGTYKYFCSIHPKMTGQIVVG